MGLPLPSVQDSYAGMVSRLGRNSATFALAIWTLSIAAAWGRWSAMALGAALCLVTIPVNIFINKVLLPRRGALVSEVGRSAFNLIAIATYGIAADWPLPVWLWLPFMGLATDRDMVVPVAGVFCVSLGGLALLAGVPILYPVMFTVLTLQCVLNTWARFAAVHDMLAMAESQRAELERVLETRRAAEERAAAMRTELVEVSRRAGMAEVATDVLHNVGNALNSVTVTANMVLETVRSSKLSALARLADLFHGEAHALPRFFAEDPRAQHIPEFLAQLTRALESERTQIAADTATLQKHIDHITTIVELQQTHATATGLIEETHLADLLEDALSLNGAALADQGVAILRDYEELPQLSIDRHKVLQILLHLISNARDAVGAATGEKCIRLRLRRGTDQAIAVEVSDTGSGISPENMVRIFNHGFTTKQGGHGFGLHVSSCAAMAMGGTLTAHSEGEGRGATFVLRLPPDRVRLAAA